MAELDVKKIQSNYLETRKQEKCLFHLATFIKNGPYLPRVTSIERRKRKQ